MATRQNIQVALDLIKFVNIVNDLLDVSVPVARGQVQIWDEGLQANRDMTVDEIKAILKRTCANITGYQNKLTNFLAVPEKKQLAIDGLSAIGVNLTEAKNQLTDMIVEKNYVNTQVDIATDQPGLTAIGDHIEANVPTLPLIRRE